MELEILNLTHEERSWLLQAWKLHRNHPELSREECIERAASGATNTESGKTERTPVSVPIITNANEKNKRE
ncbi:hypothetical protein [uncultured Dysosmobacter sp.]|uniref:hypothetical protein n=1 Tax=uncultured Dysosmobacter sp. TaxID=2591384 RepID=UPI0026148C94|nr:hypothetical protein [uncultured Dysosmobacter sp.]